ncbi:MAG: formyl transferase [Verrucomicrobia bacterium]|nr:formyl transferase [Verrucomicrobiota bacterium]
MLRVLFITQDDPFYIPHFFREFVRIFHDGEIAVLGAVIQAPLGKKSFAALVRQMFDFYGPVDFLRVGGKYAGFKVLNALAVKVFHGRFPGVFSLEHFMLKENWKIIRIRDMNSAESLQRLDEMKVDLLVSVAASQKLKPELLARPRLGCINIHNSKLPKNRGMLPNFWSLFRCDTEPVSAMTVHRMNATLDDGPIVLQKEFPLDPKETLDELIIRTKRMNAHVVLEAMQLFKRGEPPLLPNDAAQATYNTFPTKEDVRRFRAKGLRLI